MEGSRSAAEQGNTASVQPEAVIEPERPADEREHRVGARARLAKRGRLADERDREANQRDATADQRDATADQRESLADEREQEADLREAALTERLREVEERERELDERRRALGDNSKTLEERALQAIERARVLLALSEERFDRREAGVVRDRERRGREQAEIDRASAESERGQAALPPDPSRAIERAKALRRRALAAIEAFAANEDEIASIHEDLAAEHPERRDEYLRTAQQARAGARRARETVRTLTG